MTKISFKPAVKVSFVVLCLAAFASGCVVNRPYANRTSKPDYNYRVGVDGARYERTMTATGYTTLGVATAGGAVAGYYTPMVSYYDGGDKKNLAPANAAIGAVVGFGVTYFVSRALGWGKTKNVKEPEKWLRKANPQYVIYNEKSTDSFSIIHQVAEEKYIVKNFPDVEDFRKAFPNSSHSESMVGQTVDNVKRVSLPKVLAFYPETQYSLDIKRKYVTSSPNVHSLFYANDQYPEANVEIELLAPSLVRDIDDAIRFKKRFPESIYDKKVVAKSFTQKEDNIDQITSLRTFFEDSFYQDSDDPIMNELSATRKNYCHALYKLRSPKTVGEFESFYDQYSWLHYNSKQEDILDDFWSIAYDSYSDGNYLLYALKKLDSDESYSSWNISGSDVSRFVTKKMQQEVERNVNITYPEEIGTTNDEWDNWCRNDTYTAGLVSEIGDIKYLYYGKLTNRSKFDLPITVEVEADLIQSLSAQGTGFFSDLIALGMNVIGSGNNKQKLGRMKNQFIIPSLKAHSASSYAVLIDFGVGSKKLGINVADWMKFKAELSSSNVEYKVSLRENNKPTRLELERQQAWLYMARNGMPDAELTDLWRRESVQNDIWEERWIVEQDRRRRAAIEARRQADIRRRNEDRDRKSEKLTHELVEKNTKERELQECIDRVESSLQFEGEDRTLVLGDVLKYCMDIYPFKCFYKSKSTDNWEIGGIINSGLIKGPRRKVIEAYCKNKD